MRIDLYEKVRVQGRDQMPVEKTIHINEQLVLSYYAERSEEPLQSRVGEPYLYSSINS